MLVLQKLDSYRLPPYKHQIEGIERLINNPWFALFDEMGVGKTFQVINAAQELAWRGIIDRVIVIAPAAVRAVWYDPELGEIRKYLWSGTNQKISEYHAKIRSWNVGATEPTLLRWIITNYDFIRPKERHKALFPYCGKKTLLVIDESSAIKGAYTKQTKAVKELRRRCGRVVLLNGTPIANNLLDIFSQANVMHPTILDCKWITQFKARYAIMGGFANREVIGWKDVEDVQRRVAPYVIRRMKKDCLDLPPKLPSVPIFAPLRAEWPLYVEMRNEMVASVSKFHASVAAQSVVREMRLAQITSGYLGGVIPWDMPEDEAGSPFPLLRPEAYGSGPEAYGDGGEGATAGVPAEEDRNLGPLREVGRAKADAVLDRLNLFWEEDPNLKVLIWCVFRPEIERMVKELSLRSGLEVGKIAGGQTREERQYALRLMNPRTAPSGPAVVVANPAAGGLGLDLTASHTVIRMSRNDHMKAQLQAEDRTHRPGQLFPVSYFDVIATGPKGQKTIDHKQAARYAKKESLATMTVGAWIKEITEE